MIAVNIQHLSKSYGKVQALHDINLSVQQGEIFGIIGPDGAGKTTLFRILATLLLPDSGSARLTAEGLDCVGDYKKIRQIIGYMPGRFSLYQDLTVEENLEFFAAVFGTSLQENYALVAPIYSQIEPFKTRRAGALSGGMKQKLALCCALIHKPELLLLDEPGTGVDPVSRKEFWDMLATLRTQGLTILVSTPNMDEADLCDRVALMQHGRVLAVDTPQGIVGNFKSPLLAVRADDMYQLIKDLRNMDEAADCYAFGEFAHLKLSPNGAGAASKHAAVQQFLLEKNHRNVEVRDAAPSIEDCFIALMRE